MSSEPADKLLATLKTIPGGKLCVACACHSLGVDYYAVLRTMRELALAGHIIHGLFHCSVDGGVALLALLRPYHVNRTDL